MGGRHNTLDISCAFWEVARLTHDLSTQNRRGSVIHIVQVLQGVRKLVRRYRKIGRCKLGAFAYVNYAQEKVNRRSIAGEGLAMVDQASQSRSSKTWRSTFPSSKSVKEVLISKLFGFQQHLLPKKRVDIPEGSKRGESTQPQVYFARSGQTTTMCDTTSSER